MSGRVLVIMNGSVWSVGWLAEWLRGAGVVMEVVRPYAGERVPARIEADGLIVLPGSVGVYQDEDGPWLEPLRALLRRAVSEEIPTMGICFGAQILASANGGEVAPVEPEYGPRAIALTPDAVDDPLFRGIPACPPSVLWHEEAVVRLPPGAVPLAETDVCCEAFRLGDRAWGLQFHPEATVESVGRWSRLYAEKLWVSGETEASMLARMGRDEHRLRKIWRPLVERFAAEVTGRRPPLTGATSAGRWRAESPFIARSAGLPVSVLPGLRLERTTAEIDRLTDSEATLLTKGGVLAAELFEVIGQQDAQQDAQQNALRPRLVALRRKLHRGRLPSAYDWNADTAEAVPDELSTRIEAWRAEHERIQQGLQRLDALFAEDMTAARANLRSSLRSDALRRALSESAPTLLDVVDGWLDDGDAVPRARKLDQATRFLVRAATKTTPNGMLMISGQCVWADHESDSGSDSESGAASTAVRFRQAGRPIGVRQLAEGYLRVLRVALVHRPELADLVRIRLSSGACVSTGQVRTLASTPIEQVVTVGMTPGLACVLALLRDRPDWTVSRLRAAVAETVEGTTLEKATRFVDRLVKAGVLTAYLPVTEDDLDPLARLSRWIGRHDGGLRGAIDGLRDALVSDVPITDVPAHRANQAELRRSLARLDERLDNNLIPVTGRTVTTSHEYGVRTATVAELSGRLWRPALDDLDVLRRLLTIFDPHLDLRLALGRWAGRRFGAGARLPLLEFHRAMQEFLQDPGSESHLVGLFHRFERPQELAARDERIARLRALRGEVYNLSRVPGPDGVVRLDARRLTAEMTRWPAWIKPPTSVACYVHARTVDGQLELVWNDAHGGHGRNRTRVLHLLDRVSSAHHAMARDTDPGESILAELGVPSWGINARRPYLRYEIELPDVVSGRAESDRIRLGELEVAHLADTELLELRAPRFDRPVVPLHLGMMSRLNLPPIAELLMRAFSRSYDAHSVGSPLTAPGTSRDVPYSSPRVKIGHVVVQRARWVRSVTDVPARAAAMTDVDYLRALRSWVRRDRIPERCFVRPYSPERPETGKARKPLYVDFGNWWLVRGFERQAREATALMFEEALPDPDEVAASVYPYVTEFLIEMSDG